MGRIGTPAVIVMVIATLLSVTVAWRTLLTASTSASASEGARRAEEEVEEQEDELGRLIATLTAPAGPEETDRSEIRDPLVEYVPPKPVVRKTKTSSKPRPPSLKVMAVVLDSDPRAIVESKGVRTTVRLGDETAAGRVVRIETDGVTVGRDDGEKKYPYPPD